MAAADVLKEVVQLKGQLKESSNSKTILKTLKRLQELDITLNILADTGIGKAVNAYRKHSDAGEVAKSLVNQWKKLIPKEPTSPVQEQSGGEEQCHKDQLEVSEKKCFDSKKAGSTGSDTECKPGGSHRRSKVSFGQESRGGRSHLHLNNTPKNDKNKVSNPKSSPLPAVHSDGDSKFRGSRKRGVCEITNGQEAKRSQKDKKSSRAKETPPERKMKEEPSERKMKEEPSERKMKEEPSERKIKEEPSDEKKGQNGEVKKLDAEEKAARKTKKGGECAGERQPSGDELGKPTMSFESCLSYDLKAPKRKKKPCETWTTTMKLNVSAAGEEPRGRASCGKNITEQPKQSLEESPKKPSTGSVMDLLNIPLPTFLPEFEDFTSFTYFEKKSEDEACAVSEEAPVFTGQRLNKKMQVYSGTKTTFLPTMISLFQQCIRTLQNNIDLLYEIGGVPFEILEPVLERCTPEQLLRIEECNPVYIGHTDHLWERHCQRDFRNGCLEEYESWKEMHLRLSKEREKKLRKLTESIASAHSGKPKGRQVKLAFINSTVKPPRNIRIKQGLHGTAGPVGSSSLPDRSRPAQALERFGSSSMPDRSRPAQALERISPSFSGKALDSRARPGCSDVMASTSQAPDPRKIKRVAPMMAKSLRAFKKQLVRR